MGAIGGIGRAVLVVDDDEAIRGIIVDALRLEGREVMTAADGEDALVLLTSAGTSPAVILLDTRMPRMDGPAFLRAYRQLPGPHAPIVMMDAGTPSDAGRLLENGPDALLAKPFDLDELYALIRRFAGGTD